MKRTRQENIFRWAYLTIGFAVLLGIYGFLLHAIHTAQAEVDVLVEELDVLIKGNAELEKRNQELYVDFCQEAEWLQECQSSLKRPVEEKDFISEEYINNALRIKR